MKVVLKITDRLVFEIDGKSQKDIFEQLASIQEVFSFTKCEKCQSTDLKFVVREVEGNKFYELRCQNRQCRARLSFGSHKVGETLFAKKKDGGGNWLADSGWVRWDKDQQKEV